MCRLMGRTQAVAVRPRVVARGEEEGAEGGTAAAAGGHVAGFQVEASAGVGVRGRPMKTTHPLLGSLMQVKKERNRTADDVKTIN
jgi:hypothetical protein